MGYWGLEEGLSTVYTTTRTTSRRYQACRSAGHNQNIQKSVAAAGPGQGPVFHQSFRRLQERPPDHRKLLLDPHLYGRPRASGKRGPSGRSPHLPPVLSWNDWARSDRYGPRPLEMHEIDGPEGFCALSGKLNPKLRAKFCSGSSLSVEVNEGKPFLLKEWAKPRTSPTASCGSSLC